MNKYNPRKVFRMDAIHRWTLFAGAAIMCAIPLLGAVDTTDGYQLVPGVIATIVIAPIAGVLIWLGWQPRLELSAQGLSVTRPGAVIAVPWSQVERIAAERHIQGVVLRQPVESTAMQRQRWAVTRSAYDASSYSLAQLALINELRFINLSGYRRQLSAEEFAAAAALYGVRVSGTLHAVNPRAVAAPVHE